MLCERTLTYEKILYQGYPYKNGGGRVFSLHDIGETNEVFRKGEENCEEISDYILLLIETMKVVLCRANGVFVIDALQMTRWTNKRDTRTDLYCSDGTRDNAICGVT